MKLQRREKILASVALGILGLGAAYFLFIAGDSRTADELATQQTKLLAEIKDKKSILSTASDYRKQVAEWQRRSLPADPVLARSLYLPWLRKAVSDAGLGSPTIEANEGGGRKDQYAKLAFTVRAKASLGSLVDFLHKFYSAGYLHQIRKMNVKPRPDSRDLEVNLTIEALSLPTADEKAQLPAKVESKLALPTLSAYRDPIVKRNLFAAYVRQAPPSQPRVYTPPPTPRRERPSVDPADFAFVTGIGGVDGVPVIWIHDRLSDKLWKLANGEGFSVGKVQGKVESIDPEGTAVVEFDGRRRTLHKGDNLHGEEAKEASPRRP